MGLKDTELARLQFYTSDVITLHKNKELGSRRIVDGKIIQQSYSESESILIDKSTPGVLTLINKDNCLGISFEYGDGKVLYFTDSLDIYSLAAYEWQDKVGTVNYDHRRYFVSGGDVYLLVKARSVKKAIRRSRKVSGRRL